MDLYPLALMIGVVAGLRAMTAPVAICLAVQFGWLAIQKTPLGFLGDSATGVIFTVLALGELITDALPQTPSRKIPMQFAGRVLTGALSGAAIGASVGAALGGLVAGAIGAVVGTFVGAEIRRRLAGAFGHDLPAALIEDALAVAGAALVVTSLR